MRELLSHGAAVQAPLLSTWESFEVVIQEQSEFLIFLWTGVSTVPVEKDHMEEMITQCIVEVLSNALSKPNAPPINPECKEILKKGGKTDRERSEDKQLEVRHLKEPSEFENPHSESVEREQSQAEDDSKKR